MLADCRQTSLHIFSNFWRRTQATSVRTPLLAISTAYRRKDTLIAMAKARSEKKRSAQKSEKQKQKIMEVTDKAKHGRAFNETGTARPPTELVLQSCSAVGCCVVTCFNLSSHLF